ncbi:pyrimidine-nucleoside phosphorylase [mine drainage metagenome]|uniref:Pyrimidine-nucleoside phosphorylase n=1 Tax=mine drainage metagenome TaxID=410659 RepID=A0A1J5P171_9ZZZZ
MVWGGAMNMSPADDLLIRVERTLDLDSEGQLVASVLSKKAAAGSTHVVIDIPTGPTAKVRSQADAQSLLRGLQLTAHALGLTLHGLISDGSQPVGRGVGPALEALGLRVLLAQDGLEAVERLQDDPRAIDLVLMDLTMPRMDGKEAFQAMRRIRPDLRVILSSGYNEQESLQSFLGRGLAGFLQKPYTLEALRTALRKALEP